MCVALCSRKHGVPQRLVVFGARPDHPPRMRGQALSVRRPIGLGSGLLFLPVVDLGWIDPLFVQQAGGLQVDGRSPWGEDPQKIEHCLARRLPDKLQNSTASSRCWRKRIAGEVGPREWLPVRCPASLRSPIIWKTNCAAHDNIKRRLVTCRPSSVKAGAWTPSWLGESDQCPPAPIADDGHRAR